MVNTSNISQLDYTLDLVSGLSDEPIPFKSQTEKQLLDSKRQKEIEGQLCIQI